MISLGLTVAQMNAYSELLTRNHRVRVVVQLMTLDHVHLSEITNQLIDGQVSIDWGADITRSASMTFYDPSGSIQIDSNSPTDGAMFLDRMIQIHYVVAEVDSSVEYVVPIFCGPIVKLDRSYSTINVECTGKEVLALDPVWAPKSYASSALKTTVIRNVLESVGETKFSFADSTSKLSTTLAISAEDKPWSVARVVANTMNMQLFYDGRGVCVLRPYPTGTLWTFKDGAGGSVLTKPEIGYDLDTFVNAVIVNGAIPSGLTSPITYKAVADASHPLSPVALGRNGVPRYVSNVIDDDTVTSLSEATALAKAELSRGLQEAVTIAFDALPVPHLEPHDPYILQTAEFAIEGWIRQMTIPLNVAQTSSVGYLKNVTANAANIRRRK